LPEIDALIKRHAQELGISKGQYIEELVKMRNELVHHITVNGKPKS
jgi:hypothetical protein